MSPCYHALAYLAILDVLGDISINIRPVVFSLNQFKGPYPSEVTGQRVVMVDTNQLQLQIIPRGDINAILEAGPIF